jgi:hypothetical protein
MKKIINGKLYNTETATALASWHNHYFPHDFNRVDETLYRKRTGEFFIHGEGGAMTRYNQRVSGGGWCGGEGIVPLTMDEAVEWAEVHLDADDYIKIFGEPEE